MSESQGDLRPVYQPIHPDVRPKLDPQYVAFHDKYMQYIIPDDAKPWDASPRTKPSLPPGGSPLVEVGKTEDLDLGNFRIRVFVPKGSHDGSGWPSFLWFHGGGWAIGGIESENDFCTYICQEARCVVCTVDYRLAPEDVYPAAVEDAIDSLKWLCSEGKAKFDLDLTRIAIGGTSAGSNLACVTALKAAALDEPIALKFQLFIVPVVDNTATTDGIWKENQNAPWLTPQRMIWYRHLYMPNESDWTNWDASPNLAPKELIAKLPPTWMAISEQDLLAPEALKFAEQLKEAGVPADVKVMSGCTHSILALNGVLSKGQQLMIDSANALKSALWDKRSQDA